MGGGQIFPLLAENGADYRAGTFVYGPSDLKAWIDVFIRAQPTFIALAKHESISRAALFDADFRDYCNSILAKANERERETEVLADCVSLCRAREEALRRHGFKDCFLKIKKEENARALALFPSVIAEIDEAALSMKERWELLIRNVFAGNIFDLGSDATAKLYEDGSCVDFVATRKRLVTRPWVFDDIDCFIERITKKQYKKACVFVDNAGTDIVLGMLPLCRELLRGGTRVVIAANEMPSINDITLDELLELVNTVPDEVIKGAFQTGQLMCVSSGNGLPVIDLLDVSSELVAAAHGCDLVLLEGMGRSIETNLNAKLMVDKLNLGMVKHQEVAEILNCRMYDCVCKFSRVRQVQ